MSQEPITVTYSLEEVLGEIKQSTRALNQKFDRFGERLANLEVGQARIEEKIDGVSKRLENQEFTTRGGLVGLILAF